MSKGLSTAMLNALNQTAIYPALICDLNFADNSYHLTASQNNLSYNGNTYIACGDLLSVSGIEDGLDTKARGVSLTLSGLNSTFVNEITSQLVTGSSTANINVLIYNSPYGVVIGAIDLVYGYLDAPKIIDSGSTCHIELQIENPLLYSSNRPLNRTLTAADSAQDVEARAEYYGITGITSTTLYNWVGSLPQKRLLWGGLDL